MQNYLTFREFGDPNAVLSMQTKPIEPLKNNEILVRILVRPINPSDLIPIKGSYAHRTKLPGIPGYEGVGVIEAVGTNVSQELLGKRVLPLRGEGTWQEFVKTNEEFVIQIPNNIDDISAAQLYINPLTAYIITNYVLKLTPTSIVAINAGGSAIGLIFVQLSKLLGFQLISVVRNDQHSAKLNKWGFQNIVNTSEKNLIDEMMCLTGGKGLDVAIDCIGGIEGTSLAFCVRPQGHFIALGLFSGVQIDWRKISNETNINTQVFHLRHWNEHVSSIVWQQTMQEIINLVKEEKLFLNQNYATYDFLDFRSAIKQATSSKIGKKKIFLTSYNEMYPKS